MGFFEIRGSSIDVELAREMRHGGGYALGDIASLLGTDDDDDEAPAPAPKRAPARSPSGGIATAVKKSLRGLLSGDDIGRGGRGGGRGGRGGRGRGRGRRRGGGGWWGDQGFVGPYYEPIPVYYDDEDDGRYGPIRFVR